jgi:hypothetical protein
LNKLNKNYSFVYNQKLDRYDFLCNNDDETDESSSIGYFGCFRDKNADRKLIPQTLSNNNNNILSTSSNFSINLNSSSIDSNYDGYWGLFQDTHLSSVTNPLINHQSYNNDHSFEEPIFYFESSEDQFRATNRAFKDASSLLTKQNLNDLSKIDPNDQNNEENSIPNNSNCAKKLVYDYKRSKFKIEAGKRDQMKVFIQNLEDREMQLKKEIIKKFDFIEKTNYLLLENRRNSIEFSTSYEDELIANNQLTSQVKKLKKINFLHFSNKTNSNLLDQSKTKSLLFSSSPESFSQFLKSNFNLITKTNLDNFKNAFNVLSKLNKSINIFNGNYLNIDEKSYLDHFLSFFNVNASQFDLNGLLYNLNKNFNLDTNYSDIDPTKANNKTGNKSNQQQISTTISLCSNIYDNSQKPFGYFNHSTMLFEHNGVKIGFMALVDQSFFNRLKTYIEETNDQTKYVDYVLEANRLSKQLRLNGAHLVVALINFDCDQNEERLMNEANDLDLIFSTQCVNNDVNFKKINNKWLIKSSNNFDSLSLVSLNLDELNSNKIFDIAITKYCVE